jgi:hypothetical protein
MFAAQATVVRRIAAESEVAQCGRLPRPSRRTLRFIAPGADAKAAFDAESATIDASPTPAARRVRLIANGVGKEDA